MLMIPVGKQSFLVLAQDPGVRGDHGERVFDSVEVPAERLSLGPTGYRVKVVDYDGEAGVLYKAHSYSEDAAGHLVDPFQASLPPPESPQRAEVEEALLANPAFHSQNVYALVMRTLARFEHALGRRVRWGFEGHQLHIAPHAFIDANAFYSRDDRGLMFGYFKSESKTAKAAKVGSRAAKTEKQPGYVFTCLSHDIVVHETTHAVLDGLREGFMSLSGPDQAAFHEGFSDVVALLSVFSLRKVVELALTKSKGARAVVTRGQRKLIHRKALTATELSRSALLGLAEEFGQAIGGMRANALRRSVEIEPSRELLKHEYYQQAHTRGEILVAAVMRTLVAIWVGRIKELGTFGDDYYNLNEVAAEGAKVADHLLTMVIRALDYCPPLDLEFSDFLAALLTIDAEIAPDDKRYRYRETVLEVFRSYGIDPPAQKTDAQGCWLPFSPEAPIQYRRTNFESMLRDPEEVFRFVWENRKALKVSDRAYTRVTSVRPSIRIGPEGFLLRETICEYVSRANIYGAELQTVCGVKERPQGIDSNTSLTVYGAATLVFDQYGQLKFHIARPLDDGAWQHRRLSQLYGSPLDEPESGNAFAHLHRLRAACGSCPPVLGTHKPKAQGRAGPTKKTPAARTAAADATAATAANGGRS
ncbi:hypothetical protein [Paucibacter sp. PLA-PC-4]|uniref:hypothetical protein n=1 Tax=Paucibacter sp. PLA-PC-4 TaxID=2993655 RepID=UPI00224ABC1A|nr:hypothetical protein [Paucibacter sp. PLA-PC-4]